MIRSVFQLIARLVRTNETEVALPVVKGYSRSDKEYRKALKELDRRGIKTVDTYRPKNQRGDVGIEFLVAIGLLCLFGLIAMGIVTIEQFPIWLVGQIMDGLGGVMN